MKKEKTKDEESNTRMSRNNMEFKRKKKRRESCLITSAEAVASKRVSRVKHLAKHYMAHRDKSIEQEVYATALYRT